MVRLVAVARVGGVVVVVVVAVVRVAGCVLLEGRAMGNGGLAIYFGRSRRRGRVEERRRRVEEERDIICWRAAVGVRARAGSGWLQGIFGGA